MFESIWTRQVLCRVCRDLDYSIGVGERAQPLSFNISESTDNYIHQHLRGRDLAARALQIRSKFVVLAM